MTRLKDITGQRFGRLLVICRVEEVKTTCARWFCVCDCGHELTALGITLRAKQTTSCGCLTRELSAVAATKHGLSKTPEYRIYASMKTRCYWTPGVDYKDYGGRGIRVCDRWFNGENGKTGFECFLSDMGRRPKSTLSLDRKDSNGNYEPENCRWATATEQSRNRRNTVKLNGRPLTEIADEIGIPKHTLMMRWLRGDRGEFLTRPIKGSTNAHT